MAFAFNKRDAPRLDEGLNIAIRNLRDEGSSARERPLLSGREPQTQKRTTRPSKKNAAKATKFGRITKQSKTIAKPRSIPAQPVAPVQEYLIVGLDFGTTFSGMSFCTNLSSEANPINTVKEWPMGNKHGFYLVQTPTIIAFAEENVSWSKDGQKLDCTVIGYEVLCEMIAYTWFKLLMDENARITEYDNPSLTTAAGHHVNILPQDTEKGAVWMSAQYLRKFREHAMRVFAKKFGDEVFGRMQIRWWVTVPAIWNDESQARTKEALRLAGFENRHTDGPSGQVQDQVNLVSEPEAAAVAAIDKIYAQNHSFLKVDMRIMVVDIGGGTIDVENLKLKSLSPLEVELIGVGQGGKSGSTSIDGAFLIFARAKFNGHFDQIEPTKTGPGSPFWNAWETEKRSFEGSMNETFRIPLPALADRLRADKLKFEFWDNNEGAIKFGSKEMVSFFAKTIKQACNIITSQSQALKEAKERQPDLIVLAGGLCCSAYVFDQIKHFCKDKFGDNVQLLRPEDAWGAISYGAVVIGRDRGLTIRRTARRHYCIVVQRAFKSGKDLDRRMVECPLYGKRVEGSLSPLLKKGQKISENTTRYEYGYVTVNDLSPNGLVSSFKIYCSDKREVPEWTDDTGVDEIGEMEVDLSSVPEIRAAQADPSYDAAANPVEVPMNLVIKGGYGGGIINVEAKVGRKTVGEWTYNYSAS